MSSRLTAWFAVTAMPFRSSLPSVGSVVIRTAASVAVRIGKAEIGDGEGERSVFVDGPRRAGSGRVLRCDDHCSFPLSGIKARL